MPKIVDGQILPTDSEIRETQASKDMSAFPGWASWTATEAIDYIEVNVVDLASAKVVLKAMIRVLVYLRDFTQIGE